MGAGHSTISGQNEKAPESEDSGATTTYDEAGERIRTADVQLGKKPKPDSNDGSRATCLGQKRPCQTELGRQVQELQVVLEAFRGCRCRD